MNTYKISFTNTSDKKDFVLVDADNFGQAFEIGEKEIGIERMLGIDNVTGMLVDTNGIIKTKN